MIAEKTRSTILVVNDDPTICDVIEEILRRDDSFDIRRVSSGGKAMELASAINPDLIICRGPTYGVCMDFCRVAGMNDDLLSPLFLLLADGMEAQEIAEGLEQGADDYIEKSVCDTILLPKVRLLLHKRRLRQNLWREEKRLEEANGLLQRNFKELTVILLKILEVRIPGASDRAETAKAIAEFLTQRLHLHEEKRKQIIFAALLHEIGKIGLPDEAVNKHHSTLPAALLPVFQQYTTVGSMVISSVTGYKESADAVYHQLENYDGSGFPDGLMGEEIAIGARILRAIVFQEDLRGQGYSVEGIAERMRTAMHTTLDQGIANPLIEFLLSQSSRVDTNEVKLRVDELTPGMVVAEDVFAASGIKLLPKGVQLHDKMLAVLLERNETDPIIGGVYVLTDRGGHQRAPS